MKACRLATEQRIFDHIFHARADPLDPSSAHTISRKRTQQTYRFAASLPHVRGRVLDLGSGFGLGLPRLLESGAQAIVAIDPDPSVAVAPIYADPRVTLHVDTIGEVTPQPQSIDLALCISTLLYTDDPAQTLAALRPWMRPTGRLIVNVLEPAFMRALFERETLARGGRFQPDLRPASAARTMLEKAGFDIVQTWVQTVVPTRCRRGPAAIRWLRFGLHTWAQDHALVHDHPGRLPFYRFFVCSTARPPLVR